jgi:hypothetical protein
VLTGREPYSGTDGVIAAGVNEALVQDYDDVLRVGPAVPSDWDVDGTVSVQDNAKVDVQTRGGGGPASTSPTASANATPTAPKPPDAV